VSLVPWSRQKGEPPHAQHALLRRSPIPQFHMPSLPSPYTTPQCNLGPRCVLQNPESTCTQLTKHHLVYKRRQEYHFSRGPRACHAAQGAPWQSPDQIRAYFSGHIFHSSSSKTFRCSVNQRNTHPSLFARPVVEPTSPRTEVVVTSQQPSPSSVNVPYNLRATVRRARWSILVPHPWRGASAGSGPAIMNFCLLPKYTFLQTSSWSDQRSTLLRY